MIKEIMMLQENVKIIEKNGFPYSVTLPYSDYLALVEAAEDNKDVRLIQEADARNLNKKRISQAEIDEMLGLK
jgi:hypothetical protein